MDMILSVASRVLNITQIEYSGMIMLKIFFEIEKVVAQNLFSLSHQLKFFFDSKFVNTGCFPIFESLGDHLLSGSFFILQSTYFVAVLK